MLAVAGAAAAGLALPQVAHAAGQIGYRDDTTSLGAPFSPAAVAGTPRWLGHQPGKVYLGQTYSGDVTDAEAAAGGTFGVHRTFYQWTGGAGEDRTIADDHAKGRLPWVSFKPPSGAASWAPIASGAYDADIRARARRYAAFSKPIIVTFHHEPTDDSPDGAAWAGAYCRIYDVMKAETGLKNVTFVPVHMEWVWHPLNKTTNFANQFMTKAVMRRMPFLGIDVYQSQAAESYGVSLGRIFSWMAAQGFADKMIGIAETGATDAFGTPNGAKWWSDQWAWCQANPNKVGIVAYFNSSLNSRYNWLLTESPSKLAAFQASMSTPQTARLG
jgi:hypothetical protein